MHRDELGVVFYPGEGTLNVVVAGVAIVVGVGDGKIPLPNTKAMKRLGKVQFGFIVFVSPVVDGVSSGERSEAAVGQRSWLTARVDDVHESLGGKVRTECKMNELGIHNEGESPFALLNDRCFVD